MLTLTAIESLLRFDSWGKLLSTSGSLASTLGKNNPFRYRVVRRFDEVQPVKAYGEVVLMFKRNTFFPFLLVLFIAFVAGTLVVVNRNKLPETKVFDVSDYQYYIDKFPSKDSLGDISDSKDLLNKVEVIWINKYGERTKKQKPYQVFYDKANGIWLVQGTLRSNMTGGVANILVDNNTGRVLALWHDK